MGLPNLSPLSKFAAGSKERAVAVVPDPGAEVAHVIFVATKNVTFFMSSQESEVARDLQGCTSEGSADEA